MAEWWGGGVTGWRGGEEADSPCGGSPALAVERGRRAHARTGRTGEDRARLERLERLRLRLARPPLQLLKHLER